MEGYKQCPNPECRCIDVPVDAVQCPFCGYEFVKQTAAEPKGKQNKPVVKPVEEKPPEITGSFEGKREETVQKTESQPVVTGGTMMPESTDYKAYKKKGIMKQPVAGTAPQEKGGKAAIAWLAAALAVAVLLLVEEYLYRMVIYYSRMGYTLWSCIASGVMIGFLHVCCYANEKGSRRAGALGIIFGTIGVLWWLAFDRNGVFYGLDRSRYILSRYIIILVGYAVCWLIAAKLVKNKKNALVFCLTAAELMLFPFLANWLLYQVGLQTISWWQFAVSCVAMLVTDFLLYRIKSWLAQKPRKLFWVLYVIIMLGALVTIYNSRYILVY